MKEYVNGLNEEDIISKIDEIENSYINSTKNENKNYETLDSKLLTILEKFMYNTKIYVLNVIDGIKLTAKSIKINYDNENKATDNLCKFNMLFEEYKNIISDMNSMIPTIYTVNCKLDNVISCYDYISNYRTFKLQMAPINDSVITDKQLQEILKVYAKSSAKVKTK